MQKAFQDHYPDDVAHCYGCGYLNEKGLQIKSRWEGDEAVCRYTPRPEHTAFPGFVYGGLIASLVDCHSMGTAAMAWMRARGLDIARDPAERFVTGTLTVKYLRPTPIGKTLELRARAVEVGERKVVVDCRVIVDDVVCATGHVVGIRMPGELLEETRRQRGAS